MSCICDVAEETANEIEVREMSFCDADDARRWFDEHLKRKSVQLLHPVPGDWFPEHGLAAWRGRQLLAVATLFIDESCGIAICLWCVANPHNTPRDSRAAFQLIFAHLPGYARRCGAKWLSTIFGNRGVNRILEQCGFINGEAAQNKFLHL